MKRSNPNESKEIKKSKTSITSRIFDELAFFILPSRLGPQRKSLFESQVIKHGGIVYGTSTESETEYKKNVTHVICEESIDLKTLTNVCNIKDFKKAKFVKCTWLIKCLKENLCIPISEDYILCDSLELNDFKSNKHTPNSFNESCKLEALPEDITNCSAEENITTPLDSEVKGFSRESTKFRDKFACAHSSQTSPVNLNDHITNELEKLSSAYESRKDTWRAVGYQKAIAAIKSHPHRIESWEEARTIRGVGERLADKIKEIIEYGKLRKVKEVCENDETKVLEMFLGVWGAGPTTANNWYAQGFRTLDDLRTKGNLTRHQQIGVKYYSEINERIPRSEVEEIEKQVRSAAEEVKSGVEVIVCGSYRRGKATCGDVDVLVTHRDGVSHENIFKELLHKLKQKCFITDDLVVQENNGNQQKYLGICKLPGEDQKHRRLDIIVVPYKEFAPAIMYFTGSAHFNRSMRLLATKLGMSLSEHGLRAGIVRDGKDFKTGGTLLDTPTEESVFQHLQLPYRAPNERNH